MTSMWWTASGLCIGLCIGLVLAGCASPPQAPSADIRLLMLGNSHTAYHALPQRLAAMVQAARPGRTVGLAVAPGWLFLDQRLRDPATQQLLQGQRWSAVVLQGQRHGTRSVFGTEEAEALVRQARAAGALPVLFPEWARQGVDESARIHALHVGIAQRAPACVAPVGAAWSLARQRHPELQLHDRDGNHAAPAGSYLAALMLYATLTGGSPLSLPAVGEEGLPPHVALQLKTVAEETVHLSPPRAQCALDEPL